MTKQRPTVALDRYRVGPLSPYIDRFAERLREAQYCREALRHKLRVVADLSLWLQRKRVDVSIDSCAAGIYAPINRPCVRCCSYCTTWRSCHGHRKGRSPIRLIESS